MIQPTRYANGGASASVCSGQSAFCARCLWAWAPDQPRKGVICDPKTRSRLLHPCESHLPFFRTLRGHGATFKVYLPRAELIATGEGESATIGEAGRNRRPGETILIAEDEPAVRQLIARTCIKAGYSVLQAANGADAWAIAEGHSGPIHVLITDVIMPGISGRTLAEQIVQRHPEMKVLYCSGYAENAIVHHGVLDPDLCFLPKPFTAEGLLEAIRTVSPSGTGS